MFIVLAMLSGLATVVFVGTAHAQTSTADQVTLQDLGLPATPPSSGLARWWDNLTDTLRLSFTFSDDKEANLEMKRAAKSLSLLSSASTPAKAEALLVRYRAAVSRASAKMSKSKKSGAQDKFIELMLTHQAYLGQLLNSSSADLKQQVENTRGQNWEQLNVALKALTPAELAAKLQGLQVDGPSNVLRRASLLKEWRAKLTPEQQVLLDKVVESLGEKLRAISPTQAAALAERIRALSADPRVQAELGKLLEQVQPSLQGLADQLAEPRQPNQKPSPSLVPSLPVPDVAITPLNQQQLDERRRELADASTKEELLALRQEWYSSQILYRQLYQFHHSLLDQLNAKLTKALGKGSKPAAPDSTPTYPEDNVTPLPTQQLTPEQLQMGQAYIEAQGYDSADLPPPAVSY